MRFCLGLGRLMAAVIAPALLSVRNADDLSGVGVVG